MSRYRKKIQLIKTLKDTSLLFKLLIQMTSKYFFNLSKSTMKPTSEVQQSMQTFIRMKKGIPAGVI